MKRKSLCFFLIINISFALFAGSLTDILEHDSVIDFNAREFVRDGKTFLEVSGLCGSSSMSVSKIDINRKSSVISIKVFVSILHSKNASGRFEREIEIPENVTSIVFGKNEYEIWNRASPFRLGTLVKGGKIASGTTLVSYESPFSETRYEFTSDRDGTVKYYSLEYVNECESFPHGIMETEEGSDKFLYDSDSGKLTVDGKHMGNIAFLPSGEPKLLYRPSDAFTRIPTKEKNAVSAWVDPNDSKKSTYTFYADGTFKGPLSFNDVKDSYTEEDSIVRLSYAMLPSFTYLLHDGNRLYRIVDFISITDEKIHLNETPRELRTYPFN